MFRVTLLISFAGALLLCARPALRLGQVHVRFFDAEPLGIVASALCVITALAIFLLLVVDGVRTIVKQNHSDSLTSRRILGLRNIQFRRENGAPAIVCITLLVAVCPVTALLAKYDNDASLVVPGLMLVIALALLTAACMDQLRRLWR